jgi:hypothetical protein
MGTKAIWAAISGAGGLIVLGAQLSPTDAISNLQAWWEIATQGAAPAWLLNKTADYWATGVGALMFVTGLSLSVWFYRQSRSDQVPARTLAVAEGSRDILSLQKPAQFERWDHVPHLAVWQAACLWADLDPVVAVALTQGTQAYPFYSMLLRAVQHGEIVPAREESDMCYTELSRSSLIELAARKRLRPAFLFPEERRGRASTLPPPAIERDVWLLDAIGRAFLGRWERITVEMFGDGVGQESANRLGDLVLNQMRQLAYDGKIRIWGKRFSTDVWREIPPTFWADHQLDWFGFLKGTPEEFKTTVTVSWAIDNSKVSETWSELMTSRAQVEQLWPNVKRSG